MLTLAAVQAGQPDYLALAMVLVFAVVVAVMALRKRAAKKAPQVPQAPAEPVLQEEVPLPTAPGSAGRIKLHDVEPKTAAMIMAITAHKLGKPLNELRFISIKEVK